MVNRTYARGIICAVAALAVFLFAKNGVAEDKQEALPLPRFASLKVDDVNMRIGPGSRYAIKWVYKHEGLPVEIIQEFDVWREIRDADGTVGWVHKQMLQGKRAAIIKDKIAVLRKSPEEDAPAVVRAEQGVVGKLLECELEWCKIQISGHKGWILKTGIWGAYKDERF